jgi:hypothetical protein
MHEAGRLLLVLEVLHRPLVGFGGFPAPEGAQITPPTGFRIFLPRIQPVLPRLQFPNHIKFTKFDAAGARVKSKERRPKA